MKNKFPIYIVSKGRYEIRLTSDSLSRMKVDHYIVIEEQEYELYRKYTKGNPHITLLILDKTFQDNYQTLDDLGSTKSKGPGPARNFAWNHALKNGFAWHWVMDDNIQSFYRWNRNKQIRVETGAIFAAMEDFCMRYENVVMAGPNYFMFACSKQKTPPFTANTRIYSCNLIRNDITFRWRGRYNEDTILSLDILTAGLCTIQFYAFLQEKLRTQVLKGGNTGEFYAKEGTYPKSKMLVDVYPQYSRIVYKFKRVHHHVDYGPFKRNKLIRKTVEIPDGINNYGMEIKNITTFDKKS